MASCVGKSYDEILKIYTAEHGDNAGTRKSHAMWRELASSLNTPKAGKSSRKGKTAKRTPNAAPSPAPVGKKKR